MGWQITYKDKKYREDDLTLDDCEEIERRLNATWAEIDPLRSARHAKVIAIFLLHRKGGMDQDEAAATVGALKVNEFLGMYGMADPDLPTETDGGLPQ